MKSVENANQAPQNLQLRIAFVHWASCLGILCLLAALASFFTKGPFGMLAFFFYLGAGVYLSRAVLRRIIEWHPMYNTLDNVTSAKVKLLCFWPVSYLFLFIRLGINKVL